MSATKGRQFEYRGIHLNGLDVRPDGWPALASDAPRLLTVARHNAA